MIKPFDRKILRLALPNIVSNLTVPLLGMADLAILGHLESIDYLSAVALGGMVFSIIYSVFGFLRMGTSGFAAQAIGSRDLSETALVFLRAMFVALAIGFLLIALQVPIDVAAFSMIDGAAEGSESVKTLAAEYFYIRIWAAPATMAIFVFNGWFIGMQNARFPMFVAILINVINVGLNLLFVFGLNMKSDGVAYGTLIAQYSGLLVSVFLFWKYYKKVFKNVMPNQVFITAKILRFLNVNKDIFIRSFTIMLVLSFFTLQSFAENKETLAINTLLLQYFFIYAYFMDGFANAAEALTGKYIGAGDKLMLRKSISRNFAWGFYLTIPFAIVYFFAGDALLQFLTNDANLIEKSAEYLPWIALIPLVSCVAFIWDGIYIGATASAGLRNTMLIATFVFFAPTWYFLNDSLGNHALWLAFILFLFGRGLMQTIFAKSSIRIP
ncbi:MAG: MATE family efflux transporter [Bacteroidales bacterium]|nr:MATE family efflux transporter [Bacteroidales bacterium]